MNPVVETTRGRVRGRVVDGTAVFKGIPYAATPSGDRRFAAPEPAPHWTDVRDATEFGPTAPQPPYGPPLDKLLEEVMIPGENPLNLNVWTPDLEASLPVLVWIHGGAFIHGSSAIPIYDGANFARDGVVFVSINYRLGAEGFALVDDAPANRGLLDQLAALEWVRDNIAKFGGNPHSVTIVGESAGGMSVGALLAMPAAQGLFHRAIAQSGAGHSALSADTARTVSGALAEALDIEPTRGGFSAVDPDRLITAQEELTVRIRGDKDAAKWGEIPTHAMAFEPYIDGTVLPELPVDRLAAEARSDVDLLIGHNEDEMTLFFVPSGVDSMIDDNSLRVLAARYGLTEPAALDAYRSARPDSTPGQVLMHVLRDWMYRIPAVRIAEARAAHDVATYVYRFDWKTPVLDGRLGATHALDIGFAFDNLHVPGNSALAGPTPPQGLAQRMHQAWVTFVTTGAPGWAAYGQQRTEMVFGEICETVDDAEPDLRQLWHGLR